MNRTKYFNYIEEKLNTLSSRINSRGKLNVLELHVHSENFYRDFLNLLFSWNLENLNTKQHNVEAIDLVDHTRKILIQVSATNTKQKVETALKKSLLNNYQGYTFKFMSLAHAADDLKSKSFAPPPHISFSPADDIIDNASILKNILALDIDSQRIVYAFIKKELGGEIDIVKVDSNLAVIINILSKEDWDSTDQSFQINSFEIDRKIDFNNLKASRDILEDFKIHHNRLDKKYAEFDTLGLNKSRSVLTSIRNEYLKAKNIDNEDDRFFKVIDKIQERIQFSANYIPIPIEELELCINILVVDAFIRCKIFENPENYHYASTR